MFKKLLRKLFFWDDPASGAVFGWMLSAVSGYTLVNAACFGDFVVLQNLNIHNLPTGMIVSAAVSVCMLQLLTVLYNLFLSLAMFFRLDKTRRKVIFWMIAAAHLAVFFIFTELYDPEMGLLCCGILTVAGFNALCIKKDNYPWYIAQILCWAAVLPAVTILSGMPRFSVYWRTGELFPAAWRVPLVYAGIFSLIGFAFCNFKLWASAHNRRFEEVWGRKCTVLLIVFAVAWFACCCAAIGQQKKCEDALTALEENFQRKMSPDALKEIYYRGRKVDKNFYAAMKEAWAAFSADPVFGSICSHSNLDKLPEPYRRKFFSEDAEKFGKFFDGPLPANEREYTAGKLTTMLLPELNQLRSAVCFFAWQIRIACENKDYDKAMQAWKRSGVITEYFSRNTTLIEALVGMWVEQIRMDSLEIMLSSGMLRDGDLSEIQQELQRAAVGMPERSRHALYVESTIANDGICALANGKAVAYLEQEDSEGVRNYRFLAPGVWYLAGCNHWDLLNRIHAENLCQVQEVKTPSLKTFFSVMVKSLKQAGVKMEAMRMRYLAFTALIEAEKIKRQTGNYPEELPLNITDCFSGKPLRYQIGSHETEESFFSQQNGDDGQGGGMVQSRRKAVRGVAVWSVGKNRMDDNGIRSTTAGGEHSDDLRAMIILSE